MSLHVVLLAFVFSLPFTMAGAWVLSFLLDNRPVRTNRPNRPHPAANLPPCADYEDAP